MINLLFSNGFFFYEYCYQRNHYTDNRKGCEHHYIGYLKTGHLRIVTDTTEVHIAAGETFYIPRGLKYQSYWNGEDFVRFDSLGFDFFPSQDNKNYTVQALDMNEDAFQLLLQLSSNKAVSCHSIGLLYLLLDQLLPSMKFEERTSRNIAVEHAIQYMYLHDNFCIRDLARHCNISESGIYAAFKEVTGNTPVETKHKILSEKAIVLLKTTNMPIEEISQKLGFNSAIYFRKVLRNITGKTPRELRKEAAF